MLLLIIMVVLSNALEDYVWVISDTHFDSKFAEGGYSNCKMIDCCHNDSVPKNGDTTTAGFCGSHSCHAPLDTIMSGADFIYKNKDKSTTVIWLMDVIPSDMFQMTKQRNLNDLKTFHDALKQHLPGFTVLPSIGNHDYFETSFWNYPPESTWMLENMSVWWSDWLAQEQLDTVKKGGYYIIKLPNGMNVISLQTAYFDIMNPHAGRYPEVDPGDMMAWFNTTLHTLKAKGEKTIIISHECAGLKATGMMDVNAYFTQDFLSLYKEFNDVIVGHLCGHNHIESYRIYPPQNPFYSCINNPPMTPNGANPGLRLYKYSENKFVDFTTYVLDINKCNENRKYDWQKTYSACEEYGLVDLGNTEMGRLNDLLTNDDTMWAKFMKHYAMELPYSCEGTCRKQRLCSMQNMRESDYADCIN
ncbi:sphingomyelin phosphodiesterase, putative [Entamoeba invadens IP1]|uniref:Sphingomyelin phosphodiesterase, putative n=1 Tax=Entamoeba invadens IP1 TaxID=370355 RepID=A0A0A1TZL4_ENTIV|nr:sphingomyelin phosphodiesterase, putative [Entamoeba invadens IP1]ELP85620.1 sphingomyelin phosphodiesterase, putative [Entamoeba invadens IP1]|eukprot:XP_004184966.1 sphingomyelin phosphodiesterase, putative [Entamoeba invadens IP1]